MPEKKKPAANPDAAPAEGVFLAKMSEEERRELQKLVQRALHERNLPKFKSALLKARV